jgi:hypothetical protein
MDVFESIRKVLLEKRENNNPVPEGYCPNCWGREEYGGKFYSAIKKEKVDIKTLGTERHGWVLDYADKHFSAIELKLEGDMFECKRCNVKYRAV